MDESIKLKNRVYVVFLLLAFTVFYVFVFRAIWNNRSYLQEEIAYREGEVKEYEILLAEYQLNESDYDLTTDVKISEVRASIPESMQQGELIEDLLDIADQNRIELNSISFAKSVDLEQEINVLRVNASFEGTMDDLLHFLESIELNARKIYVDSISVQLSSLEIGGVRQANFSLSLESYYFNN